MQEIFLTKKRRPFESLAKGLMMACALISVLVTVGFLYSLISQSIVFFQMPNSIDDQGHVIKAPNIGDFLSGDKWEPAIGKFSFWPLFTATIMTSLIAMIVAVPLGLFVAIYLSEYASGKVRRWLKPVLEILAGVPTVVYGYFALTFLTPGLQGIFGNLIEQFNMISAGIAMGILITPLVASMSEDALSAVPSSLRQAAYGLGATKIETSLKIVLPAAISGIAAAIILGFSRAVGETMIVALASGSGAKLTFNPLEGAETLTGYVVNVSSGDTSQTSFAYMSIWILVLMLFLFTFALNFVSRMIVKRFQEVYE